MSDGGFFEQKRNSPASLVVVVAVHAAAIAALALAKIDVPQIDFGGPITVRHVPIDPDPPEIPPEPVKREVEPQHQSVLTTPKREVDLPAPPTKVFTTDEPIQTVWSDTRIGTVDTPKAPPLPPPPAPIPVPDPVRTKAKIKAGIELLPPYPASEERAGSEGIVTVRLVIGADGRVKSIEKVAAASEAFWRATERHAIRAWRFNPATVDGRAVESTQTMTVKFELRG